MPRYTAPGPFCPMCNSRMVWVLGPDPRPERGAHWLCQRDGSQWNHIGEQSQLVSLEVAEAMGE